MRNVARLATVRLRPNQGQGNGKNLCRSHPKNRVELRPRHGRGSRARRSPAAALLKLSFAHLASRMLLRDRTEQADALSSALAPAPRLRPGWFCGTNAPACDVRNLSSFHRIRRSPRALTHPRRTLSLSMVRQSPYLIESQKHGPRLRKLRNG